MNEKTEALRLAEQLEAIGLHGPVAAELRRLHAEVERIYAQHASVVSDYEKAVVTLKAQRDALLEALRPFAETDLTNPTVRDTFGFDVLFARAAIAKVEGEQA